MRKRTTVLDQLRALVADNRVLAGQGGPLHASLSEGAPQSRLTVMAGDNAGGKSLLVRILASRLNHEKTEPLQVSMRYRTSAGMHRVFMFGDDQEESTGAVSLHAVTGALRTAASRESPCWVLLDEPDTGLSESFSRALGALLAQHANALPDSNFEAMVVVTHSKALVRSLVAHATHRPHFIATGERQCGQDLEGWLNDDTERSIDELLALAKTGRDTWRAVEELLKAR